MSISGLSFVFWRIFQIVTLIPTLGMLAWFVDGFNKANQLTPTSILVLFIVSVLALAWAIFTLFSYHRSSTNARFLALIDLAFVGAFIAAVYFLKAGWWMIGPALSLGGWGGGVTDLGPTRMQDGICRQTTGYTCVAASMVTALRARGIDATETEMARLAHTQVNGGATDSRALWALQR